MHKLAAQRVRGNFEDRSADMPAILREFEERFFALNPGLRARLPEQLGEPEREFAATLATVARNLERIDVLEEPLMALGARLTRHGALPEHYAQMRDCLIPALAKSSGAAWNPQLERDWFLGLTIVCEGLLKGALRAAADRLAASRSGELHVRTGFWHPSTHRP